MIEVIVPGPLSTVQDLGRPGHAGLGVGRSGAADRTAAGLATRLVGNADSAALLEVTLGGLHLRFATAALIACTGAAGPWTVDGRAVGLNAPVAVTAGAEVLLGVATTGLRRYLAVRGGIDVAPVLGSRSTDLLSGIGPPVLTAGTRLPIGAQTAHFPVVDVAPVRTPPVPAVLTALTGPRDDWFAPSALEALSTAAWTVTPDSNRIAVRLAGPVLERAVTRELPSEPVLRGAIQVPPNGQPVLFIADHPVTGGYPVIAVVDEDCVDLAAQARPGDTVRCRLGPPRPRAGWR